MSRRRLIVAAIVLIVAVLVLTGNFPPGASSGPGGGNGDGGGSGEGQTFTGSGRTETDPFQLEGGSYRLAWWVEADGPCQYEARLRSTENQLVSQLAGKIFNITGERQERVTLVNRVAPGSYYFQVITRCRWSITVQRLE